MSWTRLAPSVRAALLLVVLVGHAAAGCLRPTLDEPPIAPPFVVRTVDGDAFSLAEERGRVVLLDFMATWCVPCRRQIPEFADVHARRAGAGLVAVSIDVDPLEDEADLRAFRDELGVPWDFALDTDGARVLYDAVTLPKQVLVDRDGRIAWETRPGEVVDGARLEREVLRLL